MLKLGTETGSLVNHLYSGSTKIQPEVGLGATLLMWSDRIACTITEVKTNKQGIIKSFIIQEDTATRTDQNGMSETQTYEYSSNPSGSQWTCKLRKNGTWKVMNYGYGVLIGTREKYYDYNF